MKYGYARVSSKAQDYTAQVEALKAAGCEKIYSEKQSGKSTNGRPEFAKLMKALLPGDMVVVTKLDRLVRALAATLCGLPEPWGGMVRHDHRRWPADADDHGRHCRVRAQPDPRSHRRGDRARQAPGQEVWPSRAA